MTAYVYDPGSDGSGGWPQPGQPVPDQALSGLGLVEYAGVRVHDGTYVLSGLGGLTDTPEVRQTLTDRAEEHGQFLSGSYYSSRTITLTGYVLTQELDQLWPALDQLRGAFRLPPARAALQQLQVLQPGWTERRFVMVRPGGPLVIAERSGSESRQPYRDWQMVLVAPDPRIYSSTLLDGPGQTQPLVSGSGSTRTLANNGNYDAPIHWVVQGPAESPKLIHDATGRSIEYVGPVPTGSTLIVSSLDRTATLNGGNVYKNLSRFDDLSIPPGGATFRALTAATNAGGTWRVQHRHVWV